MAKQLCQSCSMPLDDANKGSESDGTKSEKYCNLCYENGQFKNPHMTVAEMQGIIIKALKAKHWPGFMARMAAKQVPKLERWRAS